jgi:DNA repair protein RadC
MKKNSKKGNEKTQQVTTAVKTETIEQVKTSIQLKRDELKRLSREVSDYVKEGTFKNINMALIESRYKQNGHEVFKSYDMWKLDGYQVKKGEKAFLVWSKPIKNENNVEDQKFFRLAFLFSNLQVTPITRNDAPSTAQEAPVKYGLAEIEVTYKPSNIAVSPGKITSSRDAAEIFRNFFQSFMEYREAFYVLYLNRANKPIGIYQLGIGGHTATVADPKMALQVALKSHACGMILAHNHPSGNTQPSEMDINLTKKIKNACSFFDINLLDHVILTEDSFFSFADQGKI